MPLFAEIATPETPKVQTPDEIAQAIADQILQGAKQNLANFIGNMNQLMTALWEAPQPNVDAALIASKFGTRGVDLFAGHAAMKAAIISQEPELAKVIKAVPSWANVEFEVENDQPTGRVIITCK